MDSLQTRLDALEQRTHTVERQLRWWRTLACGLVLLGLVGWALHTRPVADAQSLPLTDRLAALQQEVAALRAKLVHLTSATSAEGHPEVVITGANLRIVNGLGSTDCINENEQEEIPDCPNGVGNLIVGYNELRPPPKKARPRTCVLARTIS
jgi:hypothetical protein